MNSTTPGIALDSGDDCYFEPNLECLSSLHLSEETKKYIWKADDKEFYCLYDNYLRVSNFVSEHNYTDKEYVAQVLNSGCHPEVTTDGTCWNFTYAGFSETISCPNIPDIFTAGANVTRKCIDGVWETFDTTSCLTEDGAKLIQERCITGSAAATNYSSACDQIIDWDLLRLQERLSIILRDIYFFGSAASLMLLTIALVIFCVFKTLQCPRVHIHKNLMISLMIQCIVNIILFEPYIRLESGFNGNVTNEELYDRTTYIEHEWLCKVLFTLSNYVALTNLFWGFVEGLFLISRISIAVFSNSTPYWLFYSIGWGTPAIFTIAWALCMHFYSEDQQCWRNYTSTDYYMLISVPTYIIALVNVIFLVCIIRILVTKLHAVNIDDHVQVRKAMKAAVVLLPLLSITCLLFIWAPSLEASPKGNFAYRITTASLNVSQGIMVSVIFCFFNGEVRSALLNHWKQWRSETFRYRSSRASSVCVTQSEHLTPLASNQLRKMSYSSHVSTGVETNGTAV